MNDEGPPTEVDAEDAVIGSLLLGDMYDDAAAITRVAGWLEPDDFYRDSNRVAYGAALALWGEKVPIDMQTLASEVRKAPEIDGVDPVARFGSLITITPTSIHIEHYGGLVKEAATKRRLADVGAQIVRSAHNGATAAEALDTATELVAGLQSKQQRRSLTADQIMVEAGPEIEELARNPGSLKGTPTPWAGLTATLVGGWRPGWLYLLAARPGHSKTRIAGLCFLEAAKHEWAYFASLEMRKEELIMRFAASRAQVNLAQHLGRTNQWNDEETGRFLAEIAELAMGQFSIDDRPENTIRAIWAEAERLKAEKGGMSLVVIDYLGLVQSTDGEDSEALRVEHTARACKRMARSLDVPVLLLHQMNRSVEGRPTLGGLRYGGEQDPDVVLYAYDEDKAHSTGEIRRREDSEEWPHTLTGRIELGILKNRHGAFRRCLLDNEATTGRLTEVVRIFG